MHRTTEEVINDHLACRQAGNLEADIAHNYSDDVTILTMEGTYHGAAGVRANAAELRGYFGPAEFSFPVIRSADRFAYIEWRTHTPDRNTTDGADSFVVENGKIVCQTIRYTVSRNREARQAVASGYIRETVMPRFENKVTRHADSPSPHYRVDFSGEEGETISVECRMPQDGRKPSRDEVIDEARRLLRAASGDANDSQQETIASPANGLTRPIEETEDRTHVSDGRDFGTQ